MKNAKKTKEPKWRLPRRDHCPLCGCRELLTEGPDQFCLSCHWDTCAEYVERGLMNNMALAHAEHFVWGREASKSQPEGELASVFVDCADEPALAAKIGKVG